MDARFSLRPVHILQIAASFVLLFLLIPASAYANESLTIGNLTTAGGAVIDSGTCGEAINWTISEDDGDVVLTLSGSGSTGDFNETSMPWAAKRTKITKVVIGEGITSIGSYAFYAHKKLASVSFSNGLQSIGRYAFAEDTALTRADLPEGLQTIGGYAFFECTGLTDVDFPSTLQRIQSDYAFGKCSGLKEVVLPDSLTVVGQGVFWDCTSLQKATVGNGLTYIPMEMFSRCSNLKTIILPSTITTVGEFSFRDCTSLENVQLPECLQYISADAFNNCSSITSIELPDALTTIRERAFQGCTSLESITPIANRVSLYWNAFSGCTALQQVTIFAAIPNNCFSGCTNLKQVIVGDGVLSISSGAFSNCSKLTELTLPDSLTEINSSSFNGCASLKYVFYSGTQEEWSDITNSGLLNATIHYQSTGHSWNSEPTVDREATCEQEGLRSIRCSVCNVIKEGSETAIDKTAHTWSTVYTIDLEPTCIAEGIKSIYCTVCNVQKENSSRAIDPLGHDYKPVVTEPTCTEGGYTTWTCSRCPNSYTDSETQALGHNCGSQIAEVPATCTEAGVAAHFVCSGCNKLFVKSGIIFEEKTAAELKIAATGHNWDSGKITKAATYDAAGIRIYTCNKCKTTRTESVPALKRTALSDATISGLASKAYTGKAIQPTPTVTVSGKTLKKDTDYTISYKNNVKVGTATVTIIGKGAYSGSKSATFSIVKAANPMTVKPVKKTVKLSKVKKKAQVVTKAISVSKAQGKVTYVKVAKGSDKALSINKTSGKITVKKGTKKGTHKIKVKVSAKGNSNYKAGNKTITVKIIVK